MCAILRTSGCVWAMARPQVTPSADWMFVIRKIYFGSGTALSNRKSVQPSTKIVSTLSSSATGPRAGVLPLEEIPVKKSIFSESLSRFSSLTLASVPAFSSALMISILRLPSSPPPSLISSWASTVPLYMGSPSTAAGPEKNVICPTLNGVSGIFPAAGCASAGCGVARCPAAPATAAEPTVTPSCCKKSRRVTPWSAMALCLPLSARTLAHA